MRNLFFSLIVFFAFLSANAEESIIIKGKILGANDRIPAIAHVNYFEGRNLKSIAADETGTYQVSMAKSPILRFTISAINHISMEYSIHTNPEDKEINLDFVLTENFIDRNFTDVGVIGNFNDYSFETPVPMTLQSDGTYSVEIDKTSDTLLYQLLGPFKFPELRSVNGKQADFYVYDGGGDYRCGITSKDKKVKITFNPGDYQKDMNFSMVRSSDGSLAPYIAARNNLDILEKSYQQIIKNFRADTSKKPELISFCNQKLETIKQEYSKFDDSRTRKYLFFEYLSAFSTYSKWFGKEVPGDINFISSGMNKIPPNDPVWEAKRGEAVKLVDMLPDNLSLEYLKKVAQSQSEITGNLINARFKSKDLLLSFNNKKELNKLMKNLGNGGDNIIYNSMLTAEEKGLKAEKTYFYDQLLKKYPKSWQARNAKREYPPVKIVDIGKQVPDFKLSSLDDDKVIITPASLKGKFVLIDIWATWCGPCLGELPGLHQAYEKFKDKNFEILSISFDDKEETPRAFRTKKWKMPWLNAFTPKQFESPIADAFEVTGIPKPVMIDPSGKIIALEADLRGANLEKTLEKYLK